MVHSASDDVFDKKCLIDIDKIYHYYISLFITYLIVELISGMENRSCVYPRGKALGGSGVIGDMVYGRGNKADFDRWTSAGNKGWSFEEVLPYFKKSEDIQITDYDKGYHGHNGELKINYTAPDPMNYDALVNSNIALGVGVSDCNGKRQTGVNRPQWTIDFNKKLAAGTAFILPIINRRTNLNVSLKSFVTRILFNGTRAVGVEFIKEGKKYNAVADKEVVLSAGAINSAQLLMLSGVGPQEHLSELGIAVLNSLPVGKYLKDHAVFIPLYVRTANTAQSLTLYEQVERYLKGETPLTSISSGGPISYINTKNLSSEDPNIEIAFLNPPQSVPGDVKMFYNLDTKHQEFFSKFNTFTDHLIYVVNLKPKSVGSLTLKSKSPVDFPIIDPAYFTDEKQEDIEGVYEGIKYVLNLTQTAPFRNINATLVGVAPECASFKERDYWICAIKYLTSTFYHPSCTTRMGVSRNDSVVDPNLKVHDMQGLRVVDAGSMHELVSGHPLGVIYMMAEKAADLIKIEYNVKLS